MLALLSLQPPQRPGTRALSRLAHCSSAFVSVKLLAVFHSKFNVSASSSQQSRQRLVKGLHLKSQFLA